jgi:transposase-like protein|tara:strand:+ start:207 stop:1430 length:1224 start_codon:yes stop_codon:yes gene_type:complete
MRKLSSSPKEVKLNNVEVRVSVIQALIPVVLEAVYEELTRQVEELTGAWYSRKKDAIRRWGSQKGSVFLGDQKVPIQVPRVRNVQADQEVPLSSYKALQRPRNLDEGLLLRVLKGISCRNYEACAEKLPEAFGLSSSNVSRRFIQVSAHKLRAFQERSLEDLDLVALVIDGKTFGKQQMIIALGITIDGQKVPLGFVESATENEVVCRRLIQELIDRGLRYKQGLLVILDGSKGLYNAVTRALQGYVCVQRCQWHKRRNVAAYLAKGQQARIKSRMQKAYETPNYKKAKARLLALKPELQLMNQSAVTSLEEGLEETLTIHRLGLMTYLRKSFRTTNCIESLNSMANDLTRNVKRWRNSKQRHRWLASVLLDIQPRLNRVMGYKYLPMLRMAIQRELGISQDQAEAA